MGGDDPGYIPLFETRRAKGSLIYRCFAASVFVGIVFIWVFRVIHLPSWGQNGRFAWIGLLGAELFFGFYWVLTQSIRWKVVYRHTFKDRLSRRYENDLPRVDVFVCTADPAIEPPLMVMNTVLSVMAYDYPPEKLSVYLSDDAGSDLTFYALLEASRFSKHWLPYCRKFSVEPRSPAAYFASRPELSGAGCEADDFASIRKLYEDMGDKISTATRLGKVPVDIRSQHEGFAKWSSLSSRRDHDTILQILIDGRDPDARDIEGAALPTLVYLAREKRPQYRHNFKAGAMNALIRVSSEISKGQIILNVDCDMYSNNSQAVRDALCFFMDEQKGHEIAFVQSPQNFVNITKNELYGSLRVIAELEFHGMDGYGGPMYAGTGCFHRRDTLSGRKFTKEEVNSKWKTEPDGRTKESVEKLEERVKGLADCAYEDNTQWGNEMGLKYGCPVEDVITGLSIQCRGWKSVFYNPKRQAFLGLSATSMDQILVQHKRWSEGDFQIFLSRYNPVWNGLGKISLGLQMGYCTYCLWAPNCLPVLYYSLVPSLYLLKGTSLFPQVSSPWFLPFAYVMIAKYAGSLVEFLCSGGTARGWWNEQRIWLYKRMTSYLYGFVDTILRQIGLSELKFVISSKVSDQEMGLRFEKEIMEFGTYTPMFTTLATLAMINLLCFIGLVKKLAFGVGGEVVACEALALQIALCGALVLINWPLYKALFLRKDKGKMPSSVTTKSLLLSLFVCTSFAFLC